MKGWTDNVSVKVLAPRVAEIVKAVDRIPFRLETWTAQEQAIDKAKRLLSHLTWIAEQVEAEKKRRREAKDAQQLLFFFPPKTRKPRNGGRKRKA